MSPRLDQGIGDAHPVIPVTPRIRGVRRPSAVIGASHPTARAFSSAAPSQIRPAGTIEGPSRSERVSNVSCVCFIVSPISCTIVSPYKIFPVMEPGTPTMTGSVNSVSSTPSANPPRSRFASESPISMLVNSLKDRLLFAVPKKGESASERASEGSEEEAR